MPIANDYAEADTARTVLQELDAERRAAGSADAWCEQLANEARVFLEELGIAPADAAEAVRSDVAAHADPVALLHDTVARIRVVRRLDRVAEIRAEMDLGSSEAPR